MNSATSLLNRYLTGHSALHRADPRVKLVVALGFIFAMTSLPPGAWPAFGVMLALVWTAVALSGVGFGLILRRSLLAIPFVLVAVPSIFARSGAVLAALEVGPVHLTATREGLDFFVSVVLKSWSSVTAAALLTAITPFLELLEALRALRVPTLLVVIVSFMYRYAFVLVDEAQRLLRARSARSARLGPGSGGSLPWRAKVAGGMAGSLFVRTYDRSERVYQAMLARGYDGRVRQLRAARLGRGAGLQVAGALLLLSGVAVLAQVVW